MSSQGGEDAALAAARALTFEIAQRCNQREALVDALCTAVQKELQAVTGNIHAHSAKMEALVKGLQLTLHPGVSAQHAGGSVRRPARTQVHAPPTPQATGTGTQVHHSQQPHGKAWHSTNTDAAVQAGGHPQHRHQPRDRIDEGPQQGQYHQQYPQQQHHHNQQPFYLTRELAGDSLRPLAPPPHPPMTGPAGQPTGHQHTVTTLHTHSSRSSSSRVHTSMGAGFSATAPIQAQHHSTPTATLQPPRSCSFDTTQRSTEQQQQQQQLQAATGSGGSPGPGPGPGSPTTVVVIPALLPAHTSPPKQYPAIDRMLQRKHRLLMIASARRAAAAQPAAATTVVDGHTTLPGSAAAASHDAMGAGAGAAAAAEKGTRVGTGAEGRRAAAAAAVRLRPTHHATRQAPESMPAGTNGAAVKATASVVVGGRRRDAAGGTPAHLPSAANVQLRHQARGRGPPPAAPVGVGEAYTGIRAWRQARVEAVVKIQAHVRGHLARTAYRQERLLARVRGELDAGRAARVVRAWRQAAAASRGRRARWRAAEGRHGRGALHRAFKTRFDGQQVLEEEGKYAYAAAWCAWRLRAQCAALWAASAAGLDPPTPGGVGQHQHQVQSQEQGLGVSTHAGTGGGSASPSLEGCQHDWGATGRPPGPPPGEGALAQMGPHRSDYASDSDSSSSSGY